MRKLNLQQLKQKAYSYERQSLVPLDGQLRRAVQIGGVSTTAAIPISLFFVPVLSSWAYAGFFWVLGDLSVALLALLRTPVGMGANVLALLGFGLLWYMTSGLQTAALAWHRVAFALAVAGAVDLVIIGLPVLLVSVNVLLWIVAIVLGMAVAILVLAVLLRLAR